MFNQIAFELLQNTLSDSRNLFLRYLPDWRKDISVMDCGLRRQFVDSECHYNVLRGILENLPFGEILSLRDQLMMNYVLFRGEDPHDFYSVGPFRSLPLEEDDIIRLRQENHLSTDGGEELRAILQRVPCNILRIEALSAARNILMSFYAVSQPEIAEHCVGQTDVLPIVLQEDFDSRAKQMEEVYAHEEQLALSIAQGNYRNAIKEARFFMHSNIEQTYADSKISHRSYLYAANTIFRKAAGGIGIHPIFLDDISRHFAHKLSLCVTHNQLNNVYLEMLESYCRMCAEYPSKQYSRGIQQIMNHIRFNLSNDLSPVSIAQAVNFSPSYVSRKFKEEVGISLMNYISNQRIQAAKQLLDSTQMSIREVAEYVGIPDWNYFTKLFKKSEGCTPSEYQKRIQHDPS